VFLSAASQRILTAWRAIGTGGRHHPVCAGMLGLLPCPTRVRQMLALKVCPREDAK
jgi:hypothetical protein